MKKNSLLLAAILVTAIACKKSTTTTRGPGVGTTQSTTVTNGFGTAGTNNINGVLYAQRLNISASGLNVVQYQAGATFSKTAKPLSGLYAQLGIPLNGEQAGVLKLDSTILKYNYTNANSNINTYSDTTTNSVYNSAKWSVGGNTNFTAFTTTVTRGYPVMTNTSYLPTTFSKSQPLTINFGSNNYSNTDSLIVLITDNGSTTNFFVYKYVAGNASSVTFTAAELSAASTTSSPEIVVYAKNYSSSSNGGKNYVFVLENDLVNYVTITP